MTSATLTRAFVGLYLVAFFAYLFGPLILMSLTAFNSSAFPRVSPWDCFTFEWFEVLARDAKLMEGLVNSLIIGAGVVVLSVVLGMAAALFLTQVRPGLRPVYYTVVISPILVPGVVLGISTLIFWDRLGTMLDASYDSVFYDGMFLTILGQSTFISAYCMLVFIARLQRFDSTLEEAALDLGATNAQAFRKILLPFLKPAIGSAAVLAFLASFENYNTTVFTIVSESTLTTVLASKVRYGINPSISALAVIIVVLTLIGALVHEAMRRREQLALASGAATEGRALSAARFAGNPAMIMLLLVFLAGLGTTWLAASYSPATCKSELLQRKRLLQQRQGPDIFRRAPATAPSQPREAPMIEPDPQREQAPRPFGDTFDPGNLRGAPQPAQPSGEAPAEQPAPQGAPAPDSGAANPGRGSFGNVFDPGNLQRQAPAGQ